LVGVKTCGLGNANTSLSCGEKGLYACVSPIGNTRYSVWLSKILISLEALKVIIAK